jgi:molybdenum cofactor guanylyltransferase
MLTRPIEPSNDYGISILTGGEGRRLGHVIKADLLLGETTMLGHLLSIVAPLNCRISLVTKNPADYAQYGLPTYRDALPGKAPIIGIYTALLNSPARYELVLAVDLPCLNTALLQYMMNRRHHADIIIPFWQGNYEPLCAIYNTGLTDAIYHLIRNQQLRPLDILDHVPHSMVTERDCTPFGDPSILFSNINTPEDYARITARFHSPQSPNTGRSGLNRGNCLQC